MQQYRSVQRRDHRDVDVQDIHEDLAAVAEDLVVSARREELEAFRIDRIHESVAASRQDHDAVVIVFADLVKHVRELLVGMAVEDQLSSVGVEGHFQDPIRGDTTLSRLTEAGYAAAMQLTTTSGQLGNSVKKKESRQLKRTFLQQQHKEEGGGQDSQPSPTLAQ